MKAPISLLIVEDNPSDIDLLLRQLKRSGLEFVSVVSDDIGEIHQLISERAFDAILTDHQLAGFTASEVLAEVAARRLDIPVLVVSGAVGEDRAAALMREGAVDFVRKENLSRLVPALQRELREAEGRRLLREATERRTRSESLLRYVVELSGDSFWEWDLETGGLAWSETFLALCGEGSSPSSKINAWRDRLHPEDREDVVIGIEAAIASSGGHWSGTFRFLRGDGTWALLTTRCFVVREEGRAVRVIGAMSDISERQSLIERQRVFTALVDQAAESIGVIDPEEGRFIEFNTTAHLSLGYTQEEFASKTFFEIDCQHSPEEIARQLQELRQIEKRDLVTRHRAKDGSVREVRLHSRPIRIQGRTYLAAVWQDVTERLAIEAELRQAQKMDIMGQMAGGVAHDFNNILAVMRLNLDLAQMNPPTPSELGELVGSLSGMVDRASSLTQRLLHISRKDSYKVEEYLLDDALDDLINVSRRILGGRIEIRRIRTASKLLVTADRSIIDQVFMNLFINARDAMPDGGVLTVETRITESAMQASGTTSRQGRRFIQIRISDTGIGMSKETLARIQEPFFTTKAPGKGTGLGLSTARRYLNEHGGWMSVESELGEGTTFTAHLPLAPSAAAVSNPDPTAGAPLPPHVLLVMEDAPLQLLTRKVLEKTGCRVHLCTDASEAMKVVESVSPSIELAIVPASMPLPGSEAGLPHRIRELLPAIPIILTRLPGDDPAPLPSGKVRVLEIPFSVASLTTLVTESLPGRIDEH
ncbi:MAG: PAS domain S-box protein [Pedosphaera sp.]|nr:PAS domain S-box protein [Pedosphaera sp.]